MFNPTTARGQQGCDLFEKSSAINWPNLLPVALMYAVLSSSWPAPTGSGTGNPPLSGN